MSKTEAILRLIVTLILLMVFDISFTLRLNQRFKESQKNDKYKINSVQIIDFDNAEKMIKYFDSEIKELNKEYRILDKNIAKVKKYLDSIKQPSIDLKGVNKLYGFENYVPTTN